MQHIILFAQQEDILHENYFVQGFNLPGKYNISPLGLLIDK